MSEDLFSRAADAVRSARGPLASRLRPTTLDDVVGQDHLVGPGAPLRVLVEAKRLTSGILWGPPGTGKTTLARIVATSSGAAYRPLSAVSAGVKDLREVTTEAARRLGEQGTSTVVFVDEVHRFSTAQQDALLPAVEDGTIILLGATTENPFFAVNGALLSRSTLWTVKPLDAAALLRLVDRGASAEGVVVASDAAQALVDLVGGDARALFTTLEVAAALATARSGAGATVEVADLERARSGTLHQRSADTHYDQVSAMIKSIRGSDPDAALYWMARLLASGEDPLFIARRLVIAASEDIGLADPMSLVVATAGVDAVRFIGLPEARLTLSQVVLHLALAPKSNSATTAIGRAMEDAGSGGDLVPEPLRDAHYRGAATLGHGTGYRYPHDDPRGWVEQDYLPERLRGRRYYEPGSHGAEPQRARWWAERGAAEPPAPPG